MKHDPLRPDPFQERDLPNPEAMLASILESASTTQEPEELDNLDYIGRRPRRWLQVVAAAAAVAVIAGIGWQVTRPQTRAGEPGSRPTPVQTA
ncbi:MAG: hypothetical protein Q4G46_00655, partial [Propionibacteriaceae bacterium]|nr:hypothetical protein [Propionibacteriaceae bacterium]